MMQSQIDHQPTPHFSSGNGEGVDIGLGKKHSWHKNMIDLGSYDMNDVTFIDVDTDKVFFLIIAKPSIILIYIFV